MRFYIERKSVRNDGSCCIRLYATVNKKSIRVSTGLTVTPAAWDSVAERVKAGKFARQTNEALKSMRARVLAAILDARQKARYAQLGKKDIIAAMNGEATLDEELFLPFLQKYAETKKGNTRMIYQCLGKRLEVFAPNVTFGEINKKWMGNFYESMGDLAENSKSVYFSKLKATLRVAEEEGRDVDRKAMQFAVKKRETVKRALPVEKMRKIVALRCTRKIEEIARDLFILMLYLRGINMADIENLTKKNIIDGRLVFYRKKTKKLYSIKIEPEAAEILDKYTSGERLFSPAGTLSFRNHILEALHGLRDDSGEIIEPGLTTYWARHSWATYAYELGIPRDIISEGLGHSFGAAVTGIYIKPNEKKVDEANRRIIDYVLLTQS